MVLLGVKRTVAAVSIRRTCMSTRANCSQSCVIVCASEKQSHGEAQAGVEINDYMEPRRETRGEKCNGRAERAT